MITLMPTRFNVCLISPRHVKRDTNRSAAYCCFMLYVQKLINYFLICHLHTQQRTIQGNSISILIDRNGDKLGSEVDSKVSYTISPRLNSDSRKTIVNAVNAENVTDRCEKKKSERNFSTNLRLLWQFITLFRARSETESFIGGLKRLTEMKLSASFEIFCCELIWIFVSLILHVGFQ